MTTIERTYIDLDSGRCHYLLEGAASDPLVILVHGATVPGWQFDRMVPRLNERGLRTLRADFYGHGYSDRPRTRYKHALFVRQLRELIARLDLRQPLHVFGHSFGASVVARLVADDPELFRGVILASPMKNAIQAMPALRLLGVPLLGELLVPSVVVPLLVRRRTLGYQDIEDGRWVGLFREQVELPGFGRAFLSMVRHRALADQSAAYRALGRTDNPVVVLHGSDDTVVSREDVNAIERLLPNAARHDIEGGKHGLPMVYPDEVARLVADFINRIGA